MNICKTVTLRTRPIKGGTQQSFYLDYYPGYRDEESMKTIRHESLGIYIYTKPKNQRERLFNETMTEKAEALRCSRFESIVNERYDFFDRNKLRGSFIDYFRKKADKKNTKWQNVLKYFNRFVNGKCTFEEINVDLCFKFMEYLQEARQIKHPRMKLHPNTISGYWSTFRAVLHTAYRDHKIKDNPNGYLERIDTIPTVKEHLSQAEVVRLAETPCDEPVLKQAFLFSVLTGLRKSDIKALTWENIQPYGDGTMYVTIRMQKTKELVNNPISEEALELIGGTGTGVVFKGFKDKMTQASLKKWMQSAGITKHITFHCARHTFGSLQVEAGTNIYVVQKMLAHKNVETTQIYAALADETKRASVNRITLKAPEKRDDAEKDE